MIIFSHLLDVRGLRDRRWAITAPWPHPATVTELGLPPNSAMAWCTQSRARLRSARPRLPGSDLVSSERNPRRPVLVESSQRKYFLVTNYLLY